jgi:amidase
MNVDPAADRVIDKAVAILRRNGAEVVDVSVGYLPRLLLGSYEMIRDTEFRVQIDEYLGTLRGPGLPRTHADILRLTELLTTETPEGWVPNPVRLAGHRREATMTGLHDQLYISAVGDLRKIARDVLQLVLATHRLDALIGPTALPARLISEESTILPPGWRSLASMAGWPDVTVPAGFTDGPSLPVGMSMLGAPFSDARLLELAYAF